jgi:hypothetical protein
VYGNQYNIGGKNRCSRFQIIRTSHTFSLSTQFSSLYSDPDFQHQTQQEVNRNTSSSEATVKAMRPTATSNDRVPFVVPRPVILRSTLSSLQAAVANNDILRLSPLSRRYSPPSYQRDSMIQQNTESDGWQRYAPRPSSSLQAAVRQTAPSAFSAATKDAYMSPNHQSFVPIAPYSFRPTVQHHQHQFTPISLSEQGSPPTTKVKPARTSFSICIASEEQKETIKMHNNEEEKDQGCNPPVPQAIVYSKERVEVYSPLTVPSHTSPPGLTERRPNAFVPIREWSTPLSTTQSLWEPKRGLKEQHWSECKVHSHQGEDEEEEELLSRTFERYGSPYHTSSPSPYRMASPAAAPKYSYHKASPYAESPAQYGYRKPSPSYCGGRTMAPSPAFTAETADLTLESMTSPYSYADTHCARNERFLQGIASPPLYRPRSSLAQAVSRSTTERPHSAPTLGRAVIKPKEADDVQQRKCRLKTELCMHYENGRPCPFGASK